MSLLKMLFSFLPEEFHLSPFLDFELKWLQAGISGGGSLPLYVDKFFEVHFDG